MPTRRAFVDTLDSRPETDVVHGHGAASAALSIPSPVDDQGTNYWLTGIGPAETASSSGPGQGSPRAEGPDPANLTIVLATHNERLNLPVLFSEIEKACGKGVDKIVVDDGSFDGTREFLTGASRLDPHIRCLFNEELQTIARAHMQGIGASRTPYIIVMDADLQHPPDAIPAMVASLRLGYDVVVATRHGPGGSPGARSAYRGLISRVAAALIKVSIKNTRPLSDPSSGFFGFRRGALVPAHENMRGFETLVFVLAMMVRPRIAEVSYCFRERGSGQSKILQGFSFIPLFLSQLVIAKRVEAETRRKTSRSGSRESAQSTSP